MVRYWVYFTLLVAIGWYQPVFGATEIKLGHSTGTQDPFHIGAAKFAELAPKYTNNSVRVTVFPNNQLGNGERELVEGVRLGTIEMVVSSSPPVAGGVEPKFMLFDLPFLFRDREHAHRVLDGPIGEKVSSSLESHGLKLLAWMESGFRNLYTTKKKVVTPDDMRGMRFRSMENPVYIAMFKSLGASAVPIPSPEVYTSLQTGVVEGADNPVGAYLGIKAYEVAKFASLTGHTYGPALLMMNLKLFNGLSKAEQDGVMKAAKEAGQYQREYVAKSLKEMMEFLSTKHGVQFLEVDKAAFQAKVGPVYKEFEAKVGGKEMIDAILQTK
jgi:tripartite ATP-independent transporter DctP family solute receptor